MYVSALYSLNISFTLKVERNASILYIHNKPDRVSFINFKKQNINLDFGISIIIPNFSLSQYMYRFLYEYGVSVGRGGVE